MILRISLIFLFVQGMLFGQAAAISTIGRHSGGGNLGTDVIPDGYYNIRAQGYNGFTITLTNFSVC